MSMNISAHSAPRIAVLALALLLGSAMPSEAATSDVYYRTVSIDQVLSTRPATVVVSPLYQVTVQVMGAEVTGISMELSKQKNFSVSRAENGKMIFLDVLVGAGGADLNLILDDETVLPIRLQVANSPSGTRVYKFMTADALAAQSAAQTFKEEKVPPAPTPTPVAPAVKSATSPTSVRPAQAPAIAKTTAAPATQPRATATTAQPPAAATPAPRPAAVQATRPVTPPAATRPVAVTPPPAAARPVAATPTLVVTAWRDGNDALVAYMLTSPTGGTLFSNVNTFQVTDGRTPLTLVPVTLPRSSMAPILGLMRVKNAPSEITASLTAQTLGPARSFTLSHKVAVK